MAISIKIYIFVAIMNKDLVGRDQEAALLNEALATGKSEFIALYGRRRVGKTFLIRSVFNGRFTFTLTGLANASLSQQLGNFHSALYEQHHRYSRKKAKDWMEAFRQIRALVSGSRQKKKVIFFDELPWFDTPHSGFIQALEHFWNSWASARKDILLVVCGSAASWMIGKLINNKGGLHNRVTQKIRLEPFTLNECEIFLKRKKIILDRYQLLQLYMVFGGIPYYWEAVKKGQSAAQNINRMCFEPNGLLGMEFGKLYKSLFTHAERHEAIVTALAKKSKGLTRRELGRESGIRTGGGLTRLINELDESGFIRRYQPFNRKNRDSIYQLCDFFSLFHLKFIKGQKSFDRNHWLKLIDSPAQRAWSGYAFEQVCLAHIPEIKKALGVSGVETSAASWKSIRKENGAQIDLLIDRRDRVINLCEMKFSINPFSIDKKYDAVLRNKLAAFKNETGTRNSVFLTMITTFGLKRNAWSGNVQNELDMNALFEKV